MFALAVAAMFILSSTAVLIEDVDATASSYKIYMTTDDQFEYGPTSNLSGTTFEFTGTIIGHGASFGENEKANNRTGTELTFRPDSSGDYSATVTATHSVSEQTATQTISIKVYAPISFTGPDSLTCNKSVSPGTTIANYTVAGMGLDIHDFTYSVYDDEDNEIVNHKPLTVDANGNLKVAASSDDIVVGDYKVVLSATKTYGSGEDNANVLTKSRDYTISVSIGDGLNFTPTEFITYAGKENSTVDFQASFYDGLDDLKYTLSDISVPQGSPNTEAAKQVFGYELDPLDYTPVDGAISIDLDTSAYSNTMLTSAEYEPIHFRMTLTGTQTVSQGGIETPVSVYKDCVLKMYRELAFTTVPTIGNVDTWQSSSSSLDVLLTFTSEGATKVTYDWGDGNVTTRNVSSLNTTFYSASHSYERPGVYTITATASNDVGEASVFTIYEADGGTLFDPNRITVKITSIDKFIKDGNLQLVPWYEINANATPVKVWTWTYQDSSMESPAPVSDIGGSVLDGTMQVPLENIKDMNDIVFKVKLSVKIMDQTYVAESSYLYNDTSFFAEHGWLFILFLILAIVFGLLYFKFGYKEIYVLTLFALFAVLAVLMFIYKDFQGLWAAIASLFG